jgi:hypothetical protein
MGPGARTAVVPGAHRAVVTPRPQPVPAPAAPAPTATLASAAAAPTAASTSAPATAAAVVVAEPPAGWVPDADARQSLLAQRKAYMLQQARTYVVCVRPSPRPGPRSRTVGTTVVGAGGTWPRWRRRRRRPRRRHPRARPRPQWPGRPRTRSAPVCSGGTWRPPRPKSVQRPRHGYGGGDDDGITSIRGAVPASPARPRVLRVAPVGTTRVASVSSAGVSTTVSASRCQPHTHTHMQLRCVRTGVGQRTRPYHGNVRLVVAHGLDVHGGRALLRHARCQRVVGRRQRRQEGLGAGQHCRRTRARTWSRHRQAGTAARKCGRTGAGCGRPGDGGLGPWRRGVLLHRQQHGTAPRCAFAAAVRGTRSLGHRGHVRDDHKQRGGAGSPRVCCGTPPPFLDPSGL